MPPLHPPSPSTLQARPRPRPRRTCEESRAPDSSLCFGPLPQVTKD